MASASKAFKKCVDPCPRYLTPDDTHNLCVFCLGKEHARDVLEGKSACTVRFFSMKKLRSRLSLFSRKEGQPSASRDSGPTAAEARRQIKLWGSQLDMADELESDRPISRASAENESELLDCDDAIFLTSSDSSESGLNGREYAAAGQTIASLHTMAVLQAYQTDLLKDLDKAFYKVQV